MRALLLRRVAFGALVLLAARASAAAVPDLVDAAKQDDRTAVTALLVAGAAVNGTAADGTSALHWAVHRGNRAIVEALLARGAQPGMVTQLGITPLDLACVNADAWMVRRLLSAGAAAQPAGRMSPLMRCARTGSTDAVAALLASGANPNALEPARGQTVLMWASAQGHADVVRALIAGGADVRARARTVRVRVNRGSPAASNYLSPRPVDVEEGGSTALFLAARNGHVDVVRALLAAGAHADEADGEGLSPLGVAVFAGREDVATLLLDAGADANTLGAGYAPLHVAVLRGDSRLVTLLLARGAAVDARLVHGTSVTRNSVDLALPDTLVGATPFLLAARFLETGLMRTLAAAGANPRLATRTGEDALMLAAGVGWSGPGFDRRDRITLLGSPGAPREPQVLEAVRAALDLGADTGAANVFGYTARQAAETFHYPDVARVIAGHARPATTPRGANR